MTAWRNEFRNASENRQNSENDALFKQLIQRQKKHLCTG